MALRKVVDGRVGVWLLYEAFHGMPLLADLITHLDVAIAGFWCGGANAKQDHESVIRKHLCMLHGVLKHTDVRYQVISRHDQHAGVAILLGNAQCCHCNCRRRIATAWLKQIDGLELLLSEFVVGTEVVIAVGHDDRLGLWRDSECTFIGLQQKAFAAANAHEGFGVRFTRNRPEPRAGTAGKNDGNQHGLGRS